jgi:hypothetical protein
LDVFSDIVAAHFEPHEENLNYNPSSGCVDPDIPAVIILTGDDYVRTNIYADERIQADFNDRISNLGIHETNETYIFSYIYIYILFSFPTAWIFIQDLAETQTFPLVKDVQNGSELASSSPFLFFIPT